MFSFFKSSKKASPPESSEESTEQSPHHSSKSDDDFILIEQRNRHNPDNPYQQNSDGHVGMYPMFGPGGGIGIPSRYAPPPPTGSSSSSSSTVVRQDSNSNFHYLQGVPFKLSSSINAGGDSTEIQRIQVDEILASLTRLLDMSKDYEFTLEQNVVSQ